jgi:hypothetical protein
MDEFESLSHTKWDCKYHVVFIPKCRRNTLYDQLITGTPYQLHNLTSCPQASTSIIQTVPILTGITRTRTHCARGRSALRGRNTNSPVELLLNPPFAGGGSAWMLATSFDKRGHDGGA